MQNTHNINSLDSRLRGNDEARRGIARVTWLGAVVNLVLVVIKGFAGYFGHSQVLIADAVHSFSDLATDAAVLVGSRYWTQPADADHPHGHSKIETVVTFFISSALALVGIGLICEAVRSLDAMMMHAETWNAPALIALVAAAISIPLKEALYQITAAVGKRFRSSAVIANAWHHRSDALSSIPAVIAVAACMGLGKSFAFLDPVGTILVASMILYSSWILVLPAWATLLDAGTTQEQCNEIERCVRGFTEVGEVHKIRTRQLGVGSFVVDLHAQVDGNKTVTEAHQLSHTIARALCEKFPQIVDVAIHVEPLSSQNRQRETH